MSEWKAQIFYDARKGRWGWPYTVFLTQSRYPWGNVESVHSTLRSARRSAKTALKKYKKHGKPRDDYPKMVGEIT